jgi:hypothetical protein
MLVGFHALWGEAKLQQATTEESLFRVCMLANLSFLERAHVCLVTSMSAI